MDYALVWQPQKLCSARIPLGVNNLILIINRKASISNPGTVYFYIYQKPLNQKLYLRNQWHIALGNLPNELHIRIVDHDMKVFD